jgi:predicted O-methyltransferase YrrM
MKNRSLVAVGEFYGDDEEHERQLEEERERHEEQTRLKFPGPRYTEWLELFHEKVKPASYVEVGVESGASLQFAKFPTYAIGIDPDPKLVHNIGSWSKIFKLESDKFFENYDLCTEFEGESVDLAFIDGLHHYDQALRDFLNVEYYSKQSSIILLHDIHPAIPETASRIRETKYWAGDTWKVMHILKKHRPDLIMYTIPTYPTSLGLITNLNSLRETTPDEINKMIEDAKDWKFDVANPINPVKNDFTTVFKLLGL